MSSVFRRTARLAAVALIAAGLAACGAKQQVPQLGEAQADKFLFDRGTEALAKKSWLSASACKKRCARAKSDMPWLRTVRLLNR